MITDQIQEAIAEATRNGIEPTKLYVGENQMSDIGFAARAGNLRSTYTNGSPTNGTRAKFQGLEIFRVDARSHLQVA